MSQIEEILDSELAPAQTLAQTTIDKLWRINPEGLRALIYGATQPRSVLTHNHAEQRGETLERSLLSLSFGPQAAEGSSSTAWQVGLPMLNPISGSFATTPAMLAASGFLLPGGVSTIVGSLAVSLPGIGARSVTLKITIRAQNEAGIDADNSGVTKTVTISIPALAAPLTIGTFTFTADEILQLGAFEFDRLLECVVWLASDSPITTAYRLLSLELRAAPNAEPFVSEPESASAGEQFVLLQPAELLTGAYLTTPLANVAKRQDAQNIFATLGKIPGYFGLSQTLTTGQSFQYTVAAQHQHTGKTLLDGACLTYGGFSQSYLAFFGEAGGQMSTDNGIGQFLYNTTRASYEGRVSFPQGLGAFYIQVAVQPVNTAEIATLRGDVLVAAINSSANIGSVSIDNNTAQESQNGARPGYVSFLFTPITTASYQTIPPPTYGTPQNDWTKRRLQADSLLPTGASKTNAYRISAPVLIQIENPTTQDLRVVLELTLSTQTNGVVSEDTSARLVWICAYPASGF